jgi:hypothetical protein
MYIVFYLDETREDILQVKIFPYNIHFFIDEALFLKR